MAKPKNNPQFIVTRQRYYYQEGQPAVEIAVGSIDSAGADALAARYEKLGEFESFADPREAVKAAVAVRDAWQKDLNNTETVILTYGAPGLLGIEPTESEEGDVIAWGERAYQALHKCDQCGDILPREYYTDVYGEGRYCREYCAENASEAVLEEAC